METHDDQVLGLSPAQALDQQGFALLPGVLGAADCAALAALLPPAAATGPGSRCLLSFAWCQALVQRLLRHPAVAALVPPGHVAVQCTSFEKSADCNWLVPVHQDLSIPVAGRVGDASLRGWAEKDGVLYVQPPAGVLEALVALRLHLDDCGADDGPLQVVPGTHRMGRIEADEASVLRRQRGLVACAAVAGDVLAMRPLVLHASSKGHGLSRRRVLHFVLGPALLPFGMKWGAVS